MRKPIAINVVAFLCAMAASLPAATSSLAQARSAGEMLGKTGKSVSGGECDQAIGVWLWKWFHQTNIVTLNEDGTGINNSLGAKSTWTCVDRTIVVRWPLSRDTVVLSPDGNKLTGSSMPLGNAISASRL